MLSSNLSQRKTKSQLFGNLNVPESYLVFLFLEAYVGSTVQCFVFITWWGRWDNDAGVSITDNASLPWREGKASDLLDEKHIYVSVYDVSLEIWEQVLSERLGSELSCLLPSEALPVTLSSLVCSCLACWTGSALPQQGFLVRVVTHFPAQPTPFGELNFSV